MSVIQNSLIQNAESMNVKVRDIYIVTIRLQMANTINHTTVYTFRLNLNYRVFLLTESKAFQNLPTSVYMTYFNT
jgi:hypothetical protein